MSLWDQDLDGVRTLVIGASSGIGEAVALAASARGARVCVAARRTDRLDRLAQRIGGCAYEVDVSDPSQIDQVVPAVASELGKIDAIVFTSAVAPFARIEETDFTTWMHAFAVNAVGATHVLRAAVPYFSADPVALVTSSREAGRPHIGVAAYNASKAALDEVWRAWGVEHPSMHVIRATIGPTRGTEILRGADQELFAELNRTWTQQGEAPDPKSEVTDVANALVSLIASARRTPSVRTEAVYLTPRPGCQEGSRALHRPNA